MKISVFGIGYVGAVSAACLAESGHDITAIDVDQRKINIFNAGNTPFYEPGLKELVERHVVGNSLRATSDYAQAVMDTELSMICVGTPGDDLGALDLKYIEDVCEQIGSTLKNKTDKHIVVIRSTVLPGTLDAVITPALERASGKVAGYGFSVANNPEFLREGSAVADYNTPTMIVVGASEEATAQEVLKLYRGIDAPKTVCSPSTAEGLKYVSNAWRANKVSFANEVGNILKAHGVDSHAVMNIFFQDTQINLGKSFLRPGFAFGGSCLPKDVRAITQSANDKGLPTPLFCSILEANIQQIEHALALVEGHEPQKVGLIGLSFKVGTDDVRESPMLMLAQKLLARGIELTIYDPLVKARKRDEVLKYLTTDINSLKHTDVIVIGHKSDDVQTFIQDLNDEKPVIDLVRIPEGERRQAYTGICW